MKNSGLTILKKIEVEWYRILYLSGVLKSNFRNASFGGISNCLDTVCRPQAAQARYVWVRASEVWSEYTRIIRVLSDAK